MEVKVITRKETEIELSGYGFDADALELLLRLSAPERHTSRVAAVKEVVLERAIGCMTPPEREVYDREDTSVIFTQNYILPRAIMLCVLDLVGIGGENDMGGSAFGSNCSTARIPQFRDLGTGRKQARDGAAWSAAIEEAGKDLLAKWCEQSDEAKRDPEADLIFEIVPCRDTKYEENWENWTGLSIRAPYKESVMDWIPEKKDFDWVVKNQHLEFQGQDLLSWSHTLVAYAILDKAHEKDPKCGWIPYHTTHLIPGVEIKFGGILSDWNEIYEEQAKWLSRIEEGLPVDWWNDEIRDQEEKVSIVSAIEETGNLVIK